MTGTGRTGFGLCHFVHWRLPSPICYFRVGVRQIGPGDLQVQYGLMLGFVLGMKQRRASPFVRRLYCLPVVVSSE